MGGEYCFSVSEMNCVSYKGEKGSTITIYFSLFHKYSFVCKYANIAAIGVYYLEYRTIQILCV